VSESGRRPATWAISTYIGFAGWWGMPSALAAAMYSPASHIATDGDSVSRYSAKTPHVIPSAAR
jgi:hypothetical protein